MKQGLNKIWPSHKDYSFLHTFGATEFDTTGLSDTFSVYDGRVIPDQDAPDTRFNPPVRPLPEGCSAETGTFASGLEDGAIYRPDDLYDNTPPKTDGVGRDARDMLDTLISHGLLRSDGERGFNRTAYFNVYAAGKIDDFDAARIAIWINQSEKRAVLIGTYWYPQFETVGKDGILPTPSFNTSQATLHLHLITGWKTINGVLMAEDISWQGMNYANAGVDYITRENYNALINQPYTGQFTISKVAPGQQVVTVGMQSYVDHLVAFIQQLFGFPVSGDFTKWVHRQLYIYPEDGTISPMPTPENPDVLVDWSTPSNAFHNTRVLCDQSGLTLEEKDIICACIYQESEFYNYLPDGQPTTHKNLNKDGSLSSTDWGIVQCNDWFHIGVDKDFPSVEFVMANPQTLVQWMINCYKQGRLSEWDSYLHGSYRFWLETNSPMWKLKILP